MFYLDTEQQLQEFYRDPQQHRTQHLRISAYYSLKMEVLVAESLSVMEDMLSESFGQSNIKMVPFSVEQSRAITSC